MKNSFIQYLINQGYQDETANGEPSTAYDYANRVERVCSQEKLSWQSLAHDINHIVSKYDTGGTKEQEGKQSHNAVINALKRFQEFCHSLQTNHE